MSRPSSPSSPSSKRSPKRQTERASVAGRPSRETLEVRPSWLEPDLAYEAALDAFVDALLAPGDGNAFIADFLRLHASIARTGYRNGLAQTLLKLTAPGVPDIYQGAELWDLSLVDPDNRRPVDFAMRATMLGDLAAICPDGIPDAARAGALFDDLADGRAKLYVIWRTLALRSMPRRLPRPRRFSKPSLRTRKETRPSSACSAMSTRKNCGRWATLRGPRWCASG